MALRHIYMQRGPREAREGGSDSQTSPFLFFYQQF